MFAPKLSVYLGVVASLFFTTTGQAEEQTWPCVQRRVDEISIGQMWATPIENDGTTLDQDAQNLAALLALRKVSLVEAQIEVDNFAKDHNDFELNERGLTYSLVLEDINHDRARLIKGIERYATGQIERAANIERLRLEMATESDAESPNFDRIDELETQLDWDTQIYTDREKALSAVCETPVLLEKRAYALAQILMNVKP